MKCQILFSEKNKKNISKCRLLKILPRVLSVKDQNMFPECRFRHDLLVYETVVLRDLDPRYLFL